MGKQYNQTGGIHRTGRTNPNAPTGYSVFKRLPLHGDKPSY